MSEVMVGLVLLLVVAVVIIFAFVDTSDLFNSNRNAIAPSTVQTHITACDFACKLGSSAEFSFCTSPRSVDLGEAVPEAPDGHVDMSCKELADKYSSFGFKPCPTQQC